MQRIKLFNSAACADDVALLERMINDWIESQRASILRMTQSQFGSHLVICVVYTQAGEQGERQAEASVAVPEVFERTMEHAELDPDESGTRNTLLPEADLPY